MTAKSSRSNGVLGSIRLLVLVPTFSLFLIFMTFYGLFPHQTVDVLHHLHQFLLSGSGSLIALISIASLLLAFLIPWHPVSRIRIGGPDAKPILNKLQVLCIAFCTTIATGILYWTSAETFLHRNTYAVLESGDRTAITGKVIAILWHHWSITPYGIFLAPTLLIAYFIYNRRSPYGISSFLVSLFGRRVPIKIIDLIDSVCIFAMIAGLAASLASGILMLSGSIQGLTGIQMDSTATGLLCLGIVICFVISSVSGLMHGIKWLSYVNMSLVLVLGLFFMGIVDWSQLLPSTAQATGEFAAMLGNTGASAVTLNMDEWTKDWPVFYWSGWIAWAPITALFLSRLTKGYTIREATLLIFVYPSLITAVWLALMATVGLKLDLENGFALSDLVASAGPEAMLDNLLGLLPMPMVTRILVLACGLVSFITSADSNITVMSDLFLRTDRQRSAALATGIKIFVGGSMGLLSWVMVTWLGVDGIRLLNHLASFPVLLLVLGMLWCFSLFMAKRTSKAGTRKYARELATGKPIMSNLKQTT